MLTARPVKTLHGGLVEPAAGLTHEGEGGGGNGGGTGEAAV